MMRTQESVWKTKFRIKIKARLLKKIVFDCTGVWTQWFALEKQVLYCLNHTSSPLFLLWLFWRWGPTSLFKLSASIGMTRVGHHAQLSSLWHVWVTMPSFLPFSHWDEVLQTFYSLHPLHPSSHPLWPGTDLLDVKPYK
jgi:hypothetical protein